MGYGYQPEYKKQLDGSATADVDCGVMSCAMGVDMASKGAKKPGRDTIRDRMGVPSGGTNMWDIERAIKSYDTTGELDGEWQKLKCRRETDGGSDGTWDAVADALPREGGANNTNGVILGVDYGMLRASNPNKTGSDSFDGWHSILLTAYDKRDGEWQVRVYDPLNDGRDGHPGPGPVWIQAHDVKQAAWSYGKAVHGKSERVAGVFLLDAVPVEGEPEPPDPEPEPCTEQAYAISETSADLKARARALQPELAEHLRTIARRLQSRIQDPTADPDAEPEDGLTT